MANTNETIKMAEKPKKESAIKTWFRENKDIIFGGIMFGLGCIVTGICMDTVVKKSRSVSYLDGFKNGMAFGHDVMLHDIPGMADMNPENVIVTWDDGFRDADFAMEKYPAQMKHMYENTDISPENIKRVREVMYIEADHRTPAYNQDTVVGFKEPTKN